MSQACLQPPTRPSPHREAVQEPCANDAPTSEPGPGTRCCFHVGRVWAPQCREARGRSRQCFSLGARGPSRLTFRVGGGQHIALIMRVWVSCATCPYRGGAGPCWPAVWRPPLGARIGGGAERSSVRAGTPESQLMQGTGFGVGGWGPRQLLQLWPQDPLGVMAWRGLLALR